MENIIQKICVIGSGVMGASIAALIANASYEVILLDIPSKDQADKNAILKRSIENLLAQKPEPLSHPNRLDFIKIGNLEDDISLIKECDLVIEVIVEKLEIKQQLYDKLQPYLKQDCILASNTSTLPLKQLKARLSDEMQSRFLITHFFNPPRYMELVELVIDSSITRDVIDRISNFLTSGLGKTIVQCNDTPGFIANRVGCFLLELVVRRAIAQDLNLVMIDHIFSKCFNLPSTGIFGLYDLIGHDVMRLISSSLILNLPESDHYKKMYNISNSEGGILDKMIQLNLIGRKGDGGFYRISMVDGKKIKEVIDLKSLSYSKVKPIEDDLVSIDSIISGSGTYDKFFRDVLGEFYLYLMELIPVVTNNIYDIDLAMKLGYSWGMGPFELLAYYIKDGFQWIKQYVEFHQLSMPEYSRNNSYTNISRDKFNLDVDILKDSEVLLNNDSASLLRYQNNLVFTIHTKMNILNPEVFTLLSRSIVFSEKQNKTLYIYPNGSNFSAGADLRFIAYLISNDEFTELDEFLSLGQRTMMQMKYSKINIVSCARGLALGGGCELLLHSSFIVANQELNAGLVEMGVGLIPAFGGTKEMFLRAGMNEDILINNLSNILLQKKTISADYFVADYNVQNLEIVMNKRDLLSRAMQLELSSKPQERIVVNLPRFDLSSKIDVKSYDELALRSLGKFQEIISTDNLDENKMLAFERKIFLELARTPDILSKIQK